MKLHEYKYIQNAFGENAKWIELSHIGLKGIVFINDSNKISRYDEIHIGKFIASGLYARVLKELNSKFGENRRLLLKIEYGILKLCVIVKGRKKLKVLKIFTIGLFYGRTFEEIISAAKKEIGDSILNELETKSHAVSLFFCNFKKSELNSLSKLENAEETFEKISGICLNLKEKKLIEKYTSY